MKPIDKLGLGPKREAVEQTDGRWLITVTPPTWSHFKGSQIMLTSDQYWRYLSWLIKGELIQNALPDLSKAQREILMSGIGEQAWDDEFKDDE